MLSVSKDIEHKSKIHAQKRAGILPYNIPEELLQELLIHAVGIQLHVQRQLVHLRAGRVNLCAKIERWAGV